METLTVNIRAAYESTVHGQAVSKEVVAMAFETALQVLHTSCNFAKDHNELMVAAHGLMGTGAQDASRLLKELITFALNQKEL